MNPLTDHPPRTVLAHFAPHTDGLTWSRAPRGFSGARVWCGADAVPRVALKAWPAGTSPDRVAWVHARLAEVAHLPFVPTVRAGAGGLTAVVDAGRVWDCGRWLPGDPRPAPTADEVARACAALAGLHAAWAGAAQRGPCPAVRNRLRILAETEPLLRAGPEALPPASGLLDPLLRRAVALAGRAAPFAARALRAWEHRTLTLHPCVRDPRGEHVLFENCVVSGIIDYGALDVDHPAADLARLLDDFAAPLEAGTDAYRRARGPVEVPDELVEVLARTGAVCSALGWVVRLVVRREVPADPPAAAARLAALLARAARLTHF